MASFLSSLQGATNKINEKRQAPAAPAADKTNCTVKLILNRNRVDVLFPEKPSEFILQALRDKGFRFRPSDKAWFHQDNPGNREFLTKLVKAEFEQDDEPTKALAVGDPGVNGAPGAQSFSPLATCEDHSALLELPDYETFKQQCQELLNHYGLDAADLMLLAVDKLHKNTFSIN